MRKISSVISSFLISKYFNQIYHFRYICSALIYIVLSYIENHTLKIHRECGFCTMTLVKKYFSIIYNSIDTNCLTTTIVYGYCYSYCFGYYYDRCFDVVRCYFCFGYYRYSLAFLVVMLLQINQYDYVFTSTEII